MAAQTSTGHVTERTGMTDGQTIVNQEATDRPFRVSRLNIIKSAAGSLTVEADSKIIFRAVTTVVNENVSLEAAEPFYARTLTFNIVSGGGTIDAAVIH